MNRILQGLVLASGTMLATLATFSGSEVKASSADGRGGFSIGISGRGFHLGWSNVPVCSRRPVHVHCFETRVRRAWVPDEYRTLRVGFDPCGRPLYQTVRVRCGYYRIVRERYCRCGVVQAW